MLFDWFTIGAQVLNFLILALLLKRFLYGPIINAMEERSRQVRHEIADAEKARKEAEQYLKTMEQQQLELEHATESMLQNARSDVESWRATAMQNAREHIHTQQHNWYAALEREKHTVIAIIRKDIAKEVFALTREILKDLSDSELELCVLRNFFQNVMHKLPPESITGVVRLKLGTGITEQDEVQYAATLHKMFPGIQEVRFSIESSIGPGVILVAGETKWEWSMQAYLTSLEDSIQSVLDKIEKPVGQGTSDKEMPSKETSNTTP